MDYTKFEVDYSLVSSCLVFIRDSLEPFDLTVPADTEAKLVIEAGTDPDGVKVYRVYHRMAALLSRALNQKHLNEGEAAKFRDADKTIAGWRFEQAELDAMLALILPVTPRRQGTTFSRISSGF